MLKDRYTLALSLVLTVLVILACASAASAETSAPGWRIMGNTVPTNLPPGGEGIVQLYVFNLGSEDVTKSNGNAIVTDTLPEDIVPTGQTNVEEKTGKCIVTGQTVRCELYPDPYVYPHNEITPSHANQVINIVVKVSPRAQGSVVDRATADGSGALAGASVTFPITLSPVVPDAGFAHVATWLTNADGTPDTQAGSHPYNMTVAFALNSIISKDDKISTNTSSFEAEVPAGGELRNLNVNLPPGIVGNPEAVPQCTRLELVKEDCPLASQVGENWSMIGPDWIGIEIYNMVPPSGVAAQFGFILAHNLVFLDSGVRTGGDNGITTHVDDIPQKNIIFNTATIWGIPADSGHDAQRDGHEANGEYCEADNNGIPCPAGITPSPLLTLPTSCQGPQEFSLEYLGTWQDEDYVGESDSVKVQDSEENPLGFTGCELLHPFVPSISIAPDTTYADTPAGLSADVKLPQGLNPEGLATPGLKNTTVVLPEGIVINPGQATGLQACQPSQEAFGRLPNGEVNEGPVSCPSASKVGTDEITTPVLPGKLTGNVYILGQNPPNLQLLMTASGYGVNVKLVGNVSLNETTGQITTTFANTPDFPVSEFKLAFSGGAQAALATPTKCGIYESTADFTPWSTPFIEDALDSSRFQITSGPEGSPCVDPMPFSPTLTAGATTDQAGGYTSFTMLLQRGDEQQRIKSLSFKTPEGLLGMISKAPLCPEPQASQGTCSAASQIGHTVVGTGPGPFPFYIPQASAPPAPIYLTGPYKGAPFGLSIVVPLIAGPFNLGTEIVRATITVDPRTSQITVTTDPLPQVVKGIPTDLRSIDAVIDRPEFMFNPTNCDPMSFTGTATSNEGATASLSSHFQVGSCQALKFQPNFKVSTSGKTSRANGASLTAKIVYPVGNLGDNQASSQSNIASVKVDLPKQLPSRLTTLQKACPAKTFEANPASCPADSIVGHGKAITPLLPVPVEGPAYFVSHAGEEFPNLIVVLQGDDVTVDLIGSTFINSKTSITSSTFKNVPDVPIQTFELNLPQGKYSALAANVNLCRSKLEMPTAFTGQNGAMIHESTPISVTGCPKLKKTSKKETKGKKKAKAKAKRKK